MTVTDFYLLGFACGACLTLVTVALCLLAILPDLAIKRKR